ncbi:hypothetical protein B0A48_14518 [Cryoendolithus antarcticus]|uniref:DUF1993 domain-containing protein n=1 Tax=Cryoendolithus antarcticus TaxID=1507870 RepID=A0A1V8SKU4_9PEZI|nr:hypothetical protein B0A48_14518 [Cryoendolithus antarcticus]
MAPLYDMSKQWIIRSVPLLTQGLRSLKHILQEGEAHAIEHSIPAEQILQARLAPDMYPLLFQIRTCSDTAKAVLVRLAVREPVVMEDNEQTFAELYARIDKTLALFDNVKPEEFEGKEGMEVVMKRRLGEWKTTGLGLLQQFALPNFYFHEAMVYALLRKEGVQIGKLDFLSGGASPTST